MQFSLILAASMLALSIPPTIEGAKILAIFPFAGPSQYILVQPYLKALAARGHELTVISAFPQKEKIQNFRDITAQDVFKNYEELIDGAAIKRNKWQELTFIMEIFNCATLSVLENKEVQQLLRSDEHFDLLIVEALQIDAVYGFAQHFNSPMIGVSSFGTDANIDTLVGNTSPLSYIPLVTAGFTDHMNFWQRIENLYLHTLEWLHEQIVHFPFQVELYKKHFPHAKVDLSDLRRNFSLMLINQHFSLSYPRPYVPNMIEVGGFHMQHKPSALPADMEAFINASKNGVIYFSMGSNIKSKDLPTEMLQVFLETFGALPQSVMWKFENDTLPGKPNNVFISKWFPQPDILAHPKVKLFITHGGLLSTIEAIYHGKPVVGMPVFYDQFLNIARATKAGYGLGVDFNAVTVNSLKTAIETIMTEPSYSNVAAKMSKRYRDQPLSPLDTAIYWTEYVLRHEGAPHMRVAAQDLNFIQYHNLDAIAVLFGGLILSAVLGMVLGWKFLRLMYAKMIVREVKRKCQ